MPQPEFRKGEDTVLKDDPKEVQVGRRDFIKTTTMAGMAATLPGKSLLGQDIASSKSRTEGTKRKLLCLCETPATFEKFFESIKAIKEIDFLVPPITVSYRKPQEVIQSIRGKDADVLLMCLPSFAFSYGILYDSLGDLDIPMILLAQNPDLIMIDANLAGAFRANGANVMFATSQIQAIELLKTVSAPRILEGKRAIIYGRPYDSTTVPAHNLNEDYVYKRTGVRIQYRPLAELNPLIASVDEASARKEAERWKKEAAEVLEASDKAILDACKLYVLLRSIIEKEGLSAVSMDCLGFTMGPNPTLPYPCLAFARLRDEGFTAACEADVCGLLSSMFLQEISRKPSFMSNVMSVNIQKSSTVLSHCVAPLKLMGKDTSQLVYRLRDYHGMGRGVVPEVEFPVGIEVVTGAFSKELKHFVLWPGRIQVGMKKDPVGSQPSPANPFFRRVTCSNYIEVKMRDIDSFLQNITGIHHIMIAGNYTKAMEEALTRMNVSIIGPSDFKAPELI